MRCYLGESLLGMALLGIALGIIAIFYPIVGKIIAIIFIALIALSFIVAWGIPLCILFLIWVVNKIRGKKNE